MSNEQHVLVQWDCENYSGFTLMALKEWEQYSEVVRTSDGVIKLELASNANLHYATGMELLMDITTKEVTASEMATIEKFFGWCGGSLEWVDAVSTQVEDESGVQE